MIIQMSTNVKETNELVKVKVEVYVSNFFHQTPLGGAADNDLDASGYTDVDWDVVTVKGIAIPYIYYSEDEIDLDEDLIERLLIAELAGE